MEFPKGQRLAAQGMDFAPGLFLAAAHGDDEDAEQQHFECVAEEVAGPVGRKLPPDQTMAAKGARCAGSSIALRSIR